MEKSLYQIFKTFFKVGTMLLGGGYVILPLLQSELVDKKHWIDDDELCAFVLSALFKAPPAALIILAIFIGLWLQVQKNIEYGDKK